MTVTRKNHEKSEFENYSTDLCDFDHMETAVYEKKRGGVIASLKKKDIFATNPISLFGEITKKERDTMNKKITLAALAAAAISASALTAASEFLWDGTTDTTGKVETGSEEETSGYWYTYDDVPNDGDSQIIFPADVEADQWDNFFGPLCEAYSGIKASVKIGSAYQYAFAGLGFNIWSKNQEGADVTAWGGICLSYTSTGSFAIELGVEDEATVTEYDNYKTTVAKSPNGATTDFPWAKFKQAGWGPKLAQADALKSAAAIKLKFEADSDILIQKVGSVGQCGSLPPTPGSIKATAAASSLKAQLNGRTLSFGKTVKAELVNLQGQVVASANASSMDLSKVQAGVYMVRAEGLSQRIMVK